MIPIPGKPKPHSTQDHTLTPSLSSKQTLNLNSFNKSSPKASTPTNSSLNKSLFSTDNNNDNGNVAIEKPPKKKLKGTKERVENQQIAIATQNSLSSMAVAYPIPTIKKATIQQQNKESSLFAVIIWIIRGMKEYQRHKSIIHRETRTESHETKDLRTLIEQYSGYTLMDKLGQLKNRSAKTVEDAFNAVFDILFHQKELKDRLLQRELFEYNIITYIVCDICRSRTIEEAPYGYCLKLKNPVMKGIVGLEMLINHFFSKFDLAHVFCKNENDGKHHYGQYQHRREGYAVKELRLSQIKPNR